MATVSLPGATQTFNFSGGAGLAVAQQIAALLQTASASGSLVNTTVTGSTVPAPGTGVNTVQQLVLAPTSSGAVSVPAGYRVVSISNGVAETVNAASGTAIVAGNGGGLFTEAGNATIVASGGSNVISQSGAGAIMLAGGDNNDTVIAGGTSGTVTGGLGSNVLTITGSNLLVQSTGTDQITVTGANDSVVGGSGPATVTATSATQVFGGSGNLTFLGGAGTSSILGGTGATSLRAGSGGLVFGVNTDNNATVNSGTGSVTVFGAGNTNTFLVGSSGNPNYLVAGTGNETLNASGSSSNNQFSQAAVPGTAADFTTMIGGSGSDTLIAGGAQGATTMTGGAGADAFVFFKQASGGGSDLITDFTSADSVFIEGYGGGGSASALQTAAAVNSAGTTLTLNDGTRITFSGLTDVTALNGKIHYS